MNRFSSILSQLLQLFPRWEFQQAVKETKAGNATYTVMGERAIPKNRLVLKDEIILLPAPVLRKNVLIPCDGSNTIMRKKPKALSS